MTVDTRFQPGDQVVHLRRPEWGSGVVRDARPVRHEGRDAQRLTIEFANHGRVVINTAIAPIALKGKRETMTRTTSTLTPRGGSQGTGWLDQLERASGGSKHELWDLPGPLTDPFEPLHRRLQATLDTYKFSTEPRSLIEWAVVQTGLDDPLTKYTRSELEHAFPRFARDRDEHLRNLVRQIKRKGDQHVLSEALKRTRLPAANNALQRAMRG
jgi:hypothetical protein